MPRRRDRARAAAAARRRARLLRPVVLRRALRRRRDDRGVRAEGRHGRAAGREEGGGQERRSPRSAGDVDLHARHRVRLAVPDRGRARLREPVPVLLGRLQLPAGARVPGRPDPRARRARRGRTRRSAGLVSIALCDHPEIERILTGLLDMGYSISPASLRLDDLTDRSCGCCAQSGERSITIAPETGSDRLRRVINKTVTNDEILDRDRADLRERHREPEAVLHDRPADGDRRGPRGDSRSDASQMRDIMLKHAPAARPHRPDRRQREPADPEAGHRVSVAADGRPRRHRRARCKRLRAAAGRHRQRVLQHQVRAAFVLPGAAVARRSARRRRRSRPPSATAATGAPPSPKPASTPTSTSSATAPPTPCCRGTSSTAA